MEKVPHATGGRHRHPDTRAGAGVRAASARIPEVPLVAPSPAWGSQGSSADFLRITYCFTSSARGVNQGKPLPSGPRVGNETRWRRRRRREEDLWDLGGPARTEEQAAARAELLGFANRPVPPALLARAGLPNDTVIDCEACSQSYLWVRGCVRCLGRQGAWSCGPPGRQRKPP